MIEFLHSAKRIAIISEFDLASGIARIEMLYARGIRAFEIVFRTSAAVDILKSAAGDLRLSGAVFGAGTVLNAETAAAAIAAGARFVVSPGYQGGAAGVCENAGVFYIPGAATATEIISAIDKGYSVLKLFPAKLLGGVDYLKSFAPVFPGVKFIPTGGVTCDNAESYLALANVLCVGGSDI